MQIHRKRNSRLNAPLQRNSKPTLCLQHRYIYIQRKYTDMIAINGIRLVSKYNSQYEKDQSDWLIKRQSTIVVYITVTIYYFFNAFYLMLLLNFRLFVSFFPNISGYINKKFQSILYISHISFCYFYYQ